MKKYIVFSDRDNQKVSEHTTKEDAIRNMKQIISDEKHNGDYIENSYLIIEKETGINKLQKIALQMIQAHPDITRANQDMQQEMICDACDFASLFITLSEDPMMTWNGGDDQ